MNFGVIALNQNFETGQKLCYMDTENFFIHIKTEDFYEDIAHDVEKWFDTYNYDEHDKRPLSIGKNKKVIGIFKDELEGNIMKEFAVLKVKACSYLTDNGSERKKTNGTKSV